MVAVHTYLRSFSCKIPVSLKDLFISYHLNYVLREYRLFVMNVINQILHATKFFSLQFLFSYVRPVKRQGIKHRVTIPCKRSFDFHMKSAGFHADFTWNLVDFMKSLVIAPYLAFIKLKSFCWNTCFIILGGFHRWNLGELCWISQVKSMVIAPTLHSSNWRVFCWNTCFYNFGWISQVKSGGNPPDFMGWNPPDFRVKSTRFLGWNPPPCFSSNWRVFAKNTCFYDFGWISQVKSGLKSARFHGWNPPPCIHQTEEFLLKHLLL